VHGGDYDEDQLKTTLPFRYFQLKQIHHVFPVSDYGRHYLIATFKTDASKVTTSHLGLDVLPQPFHLKSDRLVIVSCSAVIPLKRVHLIVEILKNMEQPATWVHFGAGELFEEVKRKAGELKHTVEFKGHVPNHEFISYLKSHPVSLFINVSESEGIPVSMMEAISQGIPLIGTKVCGVPEIVTSKTGLLLPVDFNPTEVAESITEMHRSQVIYSEAYRMGIVRFYKEYFFAEKNYRDLAALLKKI
jgi:glycosyltransferase involved in cell wall biosynthesis